MRATLRAPAPSTALLKFLKSQSESVCFFNPNLRPAFTFDHAAPRDTHTSRPCTRRISSSATRVKDEPALKYTTLQSGPPFLDFLFPRASSRSISPQSRSTDSSRKFRRQDWDISGSRHASTDRRRWWQIWGGRSLRGGQPLHPDDLPNGSYNDERSDSMFSLGRRISAKAAAQPKLRCTELDENGNIILTSGEFKKSELIQKYGLLPRDLRKIDSSLLPHIFVRDTAILINLLHLRVLIKANRVLVFDTYGTTDSVHQSSFIYDLEDKLRQAQFSAAGGGLPYEFRALEAVLVSVITGLEKEFEGVREPVVRVLSELEEDIDRDKLRYLLVYSKRLGTFEQKAKLVRDAIDELLEADDDLSDMYLTEKTHDIRRAEDDHEEVEMLLESYHKLCDEIVQESGNLVSNIRNTEEIVKAILDANRNSLMLLDLKFSIGTLGMGSGAFIAALYGMNLKNFLEESDFGFFGVTGWSFVFAGMVCWYGLVKLRKVQRISMGGEPGRRRPDRSWRVDELQEVGRRGVLERHRRLKEERKDALLGPDGVPIVKGADVALVNAAMAAKKKL